MVGVIQYLVGSKGASGFGSGSTAVQVADAFQARVSGRLFIVTGANAGIGVDTTIALLKNGGVVVMACRSEDRMAAARDLILDAVAASGVDKVEASGRLFGLILDLSSQESIRSFPNALSGLGSLPPLAALICNAGIMATARGTTADGLELQMGTNTVGHYLLAGVLHDRLIASGTKEDPARIVLVSSAAHKMSWFGPEAWKAFKAGQDYRSVIHRALHYDQEDTQDRMWTWKAYGNSKLGNVFHAREFNRRAVIRDLPVRAVVLHPGVIQTELGRNMPKSMRMIFKLVRPIQKSVPQGAATTIYCALAPPGLDFDQYYASCNVHPALPLSTSPELGVAFWDEMVDATGLDPFKPSA